MDDVTKEENNNNINSNKEDEVMKDISNGDNIKLTDPRIYINSVTGSLMPPDVDECDMYEIDSDDQRDQEDNQIDQYADVSEKDKQFYKLWNNYIRKK